MKYGNLETLRKGLGLNQLELAEKAGISQSCLSYLEHGTKYPSLYTLNSLAGALGLKTYQLVKILCQED